jgi:hypothetical protein
MKQEEHPYCFAPMVKRPLPFKIYKDYNSVGNQSRDYNMLWSANGGSKPPRRSKIDQPAYRYRNVYKSIIRHLYVYAQEHEKKLMTLLKNKGFKDKDVEKAFENIKKYKPIGIPKEIERGAKIKVEEIVKSKTALTYVLKETLIHMLDKWKNNKLGQLYKVNSTIYAEACNEFLVQIENLLDNK